ncbi:MAG: 30S ribosomal protein S16 [Candidatus Jacksonbacteria bacterium]|nr:30S ribosomal protein S16 [Candidatus Jacksonbacteria bacterium]
MIRLTRVGRRNQPFFRVVVTEKSRSTKSKVLEIVGSFNPRDRKKTLVLKKERILHWIGKGTQTSDTAHNLLVSAGILKEPKRRVTPRTMKKKKAAEAPEPAKTEASAV